MAAAPQQAGDGVQTAGPVPFFEAAASWEGKRDGRCFKLGDMGLGYYRDDKQAQPGQVAQDQFDDFRKQLPERWRDVNLREERLCVDPQHGAGVSLEHSDFGFLVEKVAQQPGQSVQPGDVIVSVEGRLFTGLSAPQMQASFLKRRVNGARLMVASLAEAKNLAERDPNIEEMWDARTQHVYYFDKRTGRACWTLEELKAQAPAPAATKGDAQAAPGQPPVDLAHFLTHGFAAVKEPPKKKHKVKEAKDGGKDESDLAREERARWSDWNAGERGGYTSQFLTKYKNCTSNPKEKDKDKRLKGSVGPGNGMEYMAKWTGSKNSFN